MNLFLSERDTSVQVESARLQGDLVPRPSLYGTDLKPCRDEELIMIPTLAIVVDSADLLYLYKMHGVEDGPCTLSEITTAERDVWDSRMMIQIDGLMDAASLRSRKK